MNSIRIYSRAGLVICKPDKGPIQVFEAGGNLSATNNTTLSDGIDITDSVQSQLIYSGFPYQRILQEDGSSYGASRSAVVTALTALFAERDVDDFLVKDENSDNSGTTKIRHKEGTGGADRDEGGTLELDLHSASIGLYGSYLKITEEDLNNTSGKNSAYGRLQVFLENAGTPVEVLDMEMDNTVQAPAVDLNTSSLDVSGDVTFSSASGTVTFSGSTSGIAYGDISSTPTIPTNVSDLTNDSGFITGANELDGQYVEYITRTTSYGNDSYEGEVLKFGAGSSLSFGQLRYMTAAGSPLAARWANADADAESTTAGLLGIALGSSPNDGFLLKGVIAFGNSFDPGDTLYVSLTAGGITNDISSYTTGDIVRIVGYALSTSLIYFNPSPDYIELS